MIILGIDALEHDLVEKFECKYLMQKYHGMTDIVQFDKLKTIVLWTSFLTGHNTEKDVGDLSNLWTFQVKYVDTFFRKPKEYRAWDVPGFTYHQSIHEEIRKLFGIFFDETFGGKSEFENPRQIKKKISEISLSQFERFRCKLLNDKTKDSQTKSPDLKGRYPKIDERIYMYYTSLLDDIGHFSFGNEFLMRSLYRSIDSVAKELSRKKEDVIILSDHGMVQTSDTMFGEHSPAGFWSTNFEDLGDIPLTEIRAVIEERIE